MESAGTRKERYVQARTDGIATLGVDGAAAIKAQAH